MKVAVFSAKRYDRELLAAANVEAGHELHYFDDLLEPATVVLAAGCGAVCVFVTGHQAFFTQEAIGTICATTVASISDYAAGRPLAHEVHVGG